MYLLNPNYISSQYSDQLVNLWIEEVSTGALVTIPCLYQTKLDSKIRSSLDILLVYSHDVKDNLLTIHPLIQLLSQKMNVITFDYPGFGLNKTSSSYSKVEDGINSTLSIVVNYCIKTLGYNSNNIILLGEGFGSGPSIWLSGENRFHGLILLSPFSSVKDMIKDTVEHYSHPKISSTITSLCNYVLDNNKWLNMREITSVTRPILILSVEGGGMCQHAERLLKNCHNSSDAKLVTLPKDDKNELSWKLLVDAIYNWTIEV